MGKMQLDNLGSQRLRNLLRGSRMSSCIADQPAVERTVHASLGSEREEKENKARPVGQ